IPQRPPLHAQTGGLRHFRRPGETAGGTLSENTEITIALVVTVDPEDEEMVFIALNSLARGLESEGHVHERSGPEVVKDDRDARVLHAVTWMVERDRWSEEGHPPSDHDEPSHMRDAFIRNAARQAAEAA